MGPSLWLLPKGSYHNIYILHVMYYDCHIHIVYIVKEFTSFQGAQSVYGHDMYMYTSMNASSSDKQSTDQTKAIRRNYN